MTGKTGFMVAGSALAQKGVAKGKKSGVTLVRVSVTLTFESVESGKQWDEEVVTYIVFNADGSPHPRQFSEAEGLAWLKAQDEMLEQEEFDIEPFFELDAQSFEAEILESGDRGMLMSGTVQFVAMGAERNIDTRNDVGFELTLYGIGLVSKNTLILTPHRTTADEVYQRLMDGQTLSVEVSRRRRRRPQ